METVTPDETAGASAQDDEFDGSPDPAQEDKPKKEKKPTPYVVLVADTRDGDVKWIEVHSCNVHNQRDARRETIETVGPIGDAVRAGEQVTLVAIPASSWKPTPVGIERSEKLVV